MQNIDVHELKQLMDENANPVLLDVREAWEYSICHIQGSKLVPMREIHNAIDELDPSQPTVVICHHGIRSQQVCFLLNRMGFNKLYNLRGGVQAWANEIDPAMPTY
ncbi:rhodanese-like domain-containing protein [Kaarinaea lacus]